MKNNQYIIAALCLFSGLVLADDSVAVKSMNSSSQNKMMTVKSFKAVGEEGIKIITVQGTYLADVYNLGSKGYDLILKSKKDKAPICFNDVTKNPNKKNHWFFDNVQLSCDK